MKHSDKQIDMIILADCTNSVQELTKLSSAVYEYLSEWDRKSCHIVWSLETAGKDTQKAFHVFTS